jgi:hypothetical protein
MAPAGHEQSPAKAGVRRWWCSVLANREGGRECSHDGQRLLLRRAGGLNRVTPGGPTDFVGITRCNRRLK